MAASRVGGYEHKFLEQSSTLKEFECPLCLHVTREPSLTSCCGQHFCWHCIDQIITNWKPCPFCKEKTFTVLLDKKQKRKILELTVSCTMKERGCTWTGNLGALAAHTDSESLMDVCQYIDVICSNKCGKSLQHRYLRVHLLNHCPNRLSKCQFCTHQDTCIKIQAEHYLKCPRFPVPCPNACNMVKIERRLLSKHLNECPKQLVECEFAYAGCTKLCRQDLEKHTEQSMQSHLSMVSSKLQEVVKEMRLLQTRLNEKDMEVRELKTRLDEKDQQKLKKFKTPAGRRGLHSRHLQTHMYGGNDPFF